MCMRKNRVIISGMVFAALTLSPLAAWSQSSPGKSGPSGSGMEQDQQRPRAPGRSRTSMNGQWSREDVRSVQEALKGKGHNPGPIDGVIGPRTQQALRAFQRAQNIQTSGQLDSSTASALGVTLSSSSSSTPGSSSRDSSGTGSSSSSNKSDSTKKDSNKSDPPIQSESGSSKGGSSKSGSSKSGTSSD